MDLHRSLRKRSSKKEGEGEGPEQWIKRVAVKGPRLEKPGAIAAEEICGGGGLPLRGERRRRRRRRRTTATFRLFLLGKGDRESRRVCIRVKEKETEEKEAWLEKKYIRARDQREETSIVSTEKKFIVRAYREPRG